jgi:hypothetical protein
VRALLENLGKPDNVAILVMIVVVAYHTWLAFAQAIRNDRRASSSSGASSPSAAPVTSPDPGHGSSPGPGQASTRVHVWPYLVRIEFLAAILITAGLLIWSVVLDAPLEEEADPSLTPNPAKAPWYFLGLQEMLVYFDPWIAGVVLPALIIFGLIAIPYLDPNPRGVGYYTVRDRPWAVGLFCFGFFGLWLSLIIIGVFLRGPGWLWFWPWEEWDRARVVAEVNVDLAELVGLDSRSLAGMLLGGAVVVLYFGLGGLLPYVYQRRRGRGALAALDPIRYATLAFLVLTMLALPIKMALRLGLNIKYIWVTPWFNV